MRLLLLLVCVAGCDTSLVLEGVCEGRLPIAQAIELRLVDYWNGQPRAVKSLAVVDGAGAPSAFAGITLGPGVGVIEVFSTDRGRGYVAVESDEERVWFQLEMDPKAPSGPPPQ